MSSRLWSFLRRTKRDREWREDLEIHLQLATEDFIAQGMSPDEARAAALRQTGNPTARLEEIYHMNTIGWMDVLWTDIRHAFRFLHTHSSFTAVAILSLAIGIGANTAVFSVINSVLLKPLAYPHAEELVALSHVAPGAGGIVSSSGQLYLSPSMYFTYSEQNRSFQTMGVWTARQVTVTGIAEPEQVFANFVSEGLLQALAVQPEIGRLLLAADQVPDAADAVCNGFCGYHVLLNYGYWQRRFGGDRSVIGRKIFVDGRPREVVGVMPAGFRIADGPVDLILPLQFDRSRAILAGFYLKGLARLKPGISIEQANADIGHLIPVWMRSWPSVLSGTPNDLLAEKVYTSWRIAPNLQPLRETVTGNIGSMLWVIMGTLGIVMLIVCANVANLLLVRADARREEFAMRAALGADWGRIMHQFLVESVVLTTIGAAAGLCAAYGALRLLVRIGPSSLPRLAEIRIDLYALLFAGAVSLLSGFVFGLIPALRYAAPRIAMSLRGAGRTMSQSRERHWARNTLVVVQVALALVLLISSGLMIRTFAALRSVQPGFTAADLQTFRIAIPWVVVERDEQVARLENAIADRLAAIPGVTAAGCAGALPMDGGPPAWDGILTEGQSYAAGFRPAMRLFPRVSPGLLSSLGTHIITGRDFSWTDVYESRNYVLVSQNLAQELWGSSMGALGKRVRATDSAPWREVIGVVEDVHYNGIDQPAQTAVYWPINGNPYGPAAQATRFVAFTVRTNRAGTESLLSEVHQAVWSVNSALPVADTATMQEIMDRSMARTSFTLVMLAFAGGMALILGLIGVYGVVAYAVSQRTREIGIRLALGALPQEVRNMFVRRGLALCLSGTVIGLWAAMGLTRLMKAVLFGVAPLDTMTFATAPIALLAATAAACYLPARRASSIDPVEAIRTE
jgi:predicted permease